MSWTTNQAKKDDTVVHFKVTFEAFGKKYYREESLYAGEGLEDLVGFENACLEFKQTLNEEGFKQVK